MEHSKHLEMTIASPKTFKDRLLATARGIDIKDNNPIIWFSNISTLIKILTPENMKLIKIIHEHQPNSLKDIALIIDKDQGCISKSLKKLVKIGVIKLTRHGKYKRPEIVSSVINLTINLLE